MHKAATEKQKFLKLCSEKDRRMLQGEIEMSFGDFDRLTYIADFLNFEYYSIEIWNKFAPQFKENFERLSRLIEDETLTGYYEDIEREIDLHNVWLLEFMKNVSDIEMKKSLKETIERVYDELGIEFPKQEETL